MRADAVLPLPSTITAWLIESGFEQIKQIELAASPDMYVANLVLRMSGADPLRGSVVAGGPMGRLEFSLTSYAHSPSSWPATRALLNDTITELFERAGVAPPREFIGDALSVREDKILIEDDLTLEVIFPDREPDQDFDVVSISVRRPLRQNEWKAWLSKGLISSAHDEQKKQVQAMEATCRQLLEREQHPLADQVLTHFMTSEDDETLVATFHTAAGASVWLRMPPGEEPSLSIVHADGRLEAW
jgi:hypothetical protein